MIYLLILLMTLLGSLAAISLKKSTMLEKKINLFFICGGGLYFLSALINVYVLKILPYAIVLPLTSITYIWTLLLAAYFFNEKLTLRKILGLSSIIIGITLLVI